MDFEKYIENEVKEGSMDYYVYTAYTDLIKKTKSFKKTMHVGALRQFIKEKNIDEIHILGHSCSIDYGYFKIINDSYPNATWYFNPFSNKDKENMIKLIEEYSIRKYFIKELGESFK